MHLPKKVHLGDNVSHLFFQSEEEEGMDCTETNAARAICRILWSPLPLLLHFLGTESDPGSLCFSFFPLTGAISVVPLLALSRRQPGGFYNGVHVK